MFPNQAIMSCFLKSGDTDNLKFNVKKVENTDCAKTASNVHIMSLTNKNGIEFRLNLSRLLPSIADRMT